MEPEEPVEAEYVVDEHAPVPPEHGGGVNADLPEGEQGLVLSVK